MKNLTVKQLKKGIEVFLVSPWNHSYACSGNHTNKPDEQDSYRIEKVTIHSCGAKRMYVTNCDSFTKQKYNVRNDGTFGNIWFCSTKNEAEELIKEKHESNPTKTDRYFIVYI